MIPILLKLIRSPAAWMTAAIVAVVLFIAVLMNQNSSMSVKLDAQEATISELQKTTEILQAGQVIQQRDMERLNDIANYKQTVVIREQNLENDLDNIPETQDRPFADGNNLAYAHRLREHQQAITNELTADQPK